MENNVEEIKIWEGVNVITENKTIFCDSPLKLWRLFGWDIKPTKATKECETEINRQLFGWGRVDLTSINHGKKLILEVVPCKD